MGNDLVNLSRMPAPVLTLEPGADDGLSVAEMIDAELGEKDGPMLADGLTSDELAQVDDFARKIDVTSSQQMMSFGSAAQRRIASFSEVALARIGALDLKETSGLIVEMVAELRRFSVDADDKGFFAFFRRRKDKLASLKDRYVSAEAKVDKITKTLEGHLLVLMKDVATLGRLYELNLSHCKELTMYILAGRKCLDEARENELARLAEKARMSGSIEDSEAVQRFSAACNHFEKKLSDLNLSRVVSLQMAPQIRLVQSSEMLMIEKIRTTLASTIPLWKSQMVLSLGLADSKEALRVQSAVASATNELLRENVDELRRSVVEVARESERGVVDIEALKATNEELIQAFDEVLKIQSESRVKRVEAEDEIHRMETELRNKLVEVQEL